MWRLCCVSHCSVPTASPVALPSKPFRKTKFYKIHLSNSVGPLSAQPGLGSLAFFGFVPLFVSSSCFVLASSTVCGGSVA